MRGAEGSGPEGPAWSDPVRAVTSFFRDDPNRILLVADSLRRTGRELESTVQGASMGRTLPAGSRVRIALAAREQYEVGEVVAFLAGSQLVVHRVAHRRGRGQRASLLLTRGDALLVPDRPITQDRILGVVTAVHRDGEWSAPGDRPCRSPLARLAARFLLVTSTGLLRLSPQAVQVLVDALHPVEGGLLRASRRLRGRFRGFGTHDPH